MLSTAQPPAQSVAFAAGEAVPAVSVAPVTIACVFRTQRAGSAVALN